MTYKNYAVVVMSKNYNTIENNFSTYDSYDDAFDAFNNAIADCGGEQLYSQSKGERPLRVVTDDDFVELWIITRTDDLVKNKEK